MAINSATEDETIRLAVSFRQSLRECTKCRLHENATPIPWHGDLQPDFALIGEAPGERESIEGRPFVGKSGHSLRQWLRERGINPDKVTMLNSVACRPERNRTPHDDELATCFPWVNGSLEFIRPKVLITVGTVAFHQVRQRKWPKLINVHGKPWFHPRYRFNVISTYHPAAALRSKKYETVIKSDLDNLVRLMKQGLPWPAYDECYIDKCGGELYRFMGDGIGICERHAMTQGYLFD